MISTSTREVETRDDKSKIGRKVRGEKVWVWMIVGINSASHVKSYVNVTSPVCNANGFLNMAADKHKIVFQFRGLGSCNSTLHSLSFTAWDLQEQKSRMSIAITGPRSISLEKVDVQRGRESPKPLPCVCLGRRQRAWISPVVNFGMKSEPGCKLILRTYCWGCDGGLRNPECSARRSERCYALHNLPCLIRWLSAPVFSILWRTRMIFPRNILPRCFTKISECMSRSARRWTPLHMLAKLIIAIK